MHMVHRIHNPPVVTNSGVSLAVSARRLGALMGGSYGSLETIAGLPAMVGRCVRLGGDSKGTKVGLMIIVTRAYEAPT
ncbi:hypothetical protein YTPLAS18_30600 [Nitrospira sp.]|nr:hypothetical protein YTPLAS18_30600 [Nitrospira sp.]